MRKWRVWATFFRGHMTQREKEGIASSSVYTPHKKKKKAGGRYNKKRKRISVSTPP